MEPAQNNLFAREHAREVADRIALVRALKRRKGPNHFSQAELDAVLPKSPWERIRRREPGGVGRA